MHTSRHTACHTLKDKIWLRTAAQCPNKNTTLSKNEENEEDARLTVIDCNSESSLIWTLSDMMEPHTRSARHKMARSMKYV